MIFRLAALVVVVTVAPLRAGLDEYVARPEPAFAWQLRDKQALPQGIVYEIGLVSQTWQGITWKHRLLVFQPKGAPPTGTMLLLNTGGNGDKPRDRILGLTLATKIQAPVAVLFNIPNQPLFDGKKEDALIAETFVRFLAAGGKDESWPLLFPMVKSVVKAMDALQAFAKQEWQKPVEKFVVTGASKRGWTTWLTAATRDKRVKAIAPMVIDTLDMPKQMAHQLACYGTFSDMIHDYVERKLVPVPKTMAALRLWKMVDPYQYRDRLALPKLIVSGANDPYWTVDAVSLFWNGLPGPKWLTSVPNAGHDLRQVSPSGEKGQATWALDTLAAFARAQIFDKPLPSPEWQVNGTGLTVTNAAGAKSARLWIANSTTQDFRPVRWEPKDVTLPTVAEGKSAGLEVSAGVPASGYRAYFLELDYELDGLKLRLCTPPRMVGAGK